MNLKNVIKNTSVIIKFKDLPSSAGQKFDKIKQSEFVDITNCKRFTLKVEHGVKFAFNEKEHVPQLIQVIPNNPNHEGDDTYIFMPGKGIKQGEVFPPNGDIEVTDPNEDEPP